MALKTHLALRVPSSGRKTTNWHDLRRSRFSSFKVPSHEGVERSRERAQRARERSQQRQDKKTAMESLAARTAAEEARFFRAEDDNALRRRMERLVRGQAAASGSTSTTTTTAAARLNDFERECLAARREGLASASVSVVRTANPLKVDIDVEGHARRVPHHSTFVDYLNVPRVSSRPSGPRPRKRVFVVLTQPSSSRSPRSPRAAGRSAWAAPSGRSTRTRACSP